MVLAIAWPVRVEIQREARNRFGCRCHPVQGRASQLFSVRLDGGSRRLKDMGSNAQSPAECEHLAGVWQGVDEGGVFLDTESDRETYSKYVEEWFRFCPRCGNPMPGPERPAGLFLGGIERMTPCEEKLVRVGVCPRCLPNEGRPPQMRLLGDFGPMRAWQCGRCNNVWASVTD